MEEEREKEKEGDGRRRERNEEGEGEDYSFKLYSMHFFFNRNAILNKKRAKKFRD